MSPVCHSSFLYSTSSSGWLHTLTCVGYASRMKDWGVATTRSTLTCQIMCPKQGLLHQEKGEALWCAHGAGCSQSHVPWELPPHPGRVVLQFVTNVLCLLLIFSLFSSFRPRYPLTVTRHCYWWFFRPIVSTWFWLRTLIGIQKKFLSIFPWHGYLYGTDVCIVRITKYMNKYKGNKDKMNTIFSVLTNIMALAITLSQGTTSTEDKVNH